MITFLFTTEESTAGDLASLLMEHQIKYSLVKSSDSFTFSVHQSAVEKAYWLIREYRHELLGQISQDAKNLVLAIKKVTYSLLDR